ncbi:hypothetical protein [Caldimonas brevitalea]|uniref:Uncharacterized protein n=1 Tax=Caldimonas brevitalea TaxID=413882 RepID=A0A0G3BLJ5_9BURK|nr:hypothetical protein [Caldimonas brevitalea]AKJ30304.1 hypothetical protein AAW51_3613 [Caldimonas brevitalea]
MGKSTAALALALAGFGLLQNALAEPAEKIPPCYGPKRWATQIALDQMVEAGLIRDVASIYREGDTPYFLKTKLLESKKIGEYTSPGYPPESIYRQIQQFVVKTKEGQSYEVLTISEASPKECSMASLATVVLSPEFRILNTGKSVLDKKK